MSATLTYEKKVPAGMFEPTQVKVVTTTQESVDIPCGFFPSRVEVVENGTIDSIVIWTADMEDGAYMIVATAAGFQLDPFVTETQSGDRGCRVQLYELGSAGTFYITLWR